MDEDTRSLPPGVPGHKKGRRSSGEADRAAQETSQMEQLRFRIAF